MKVCIHQPFSPKDTKTCVALRGHGDGEMVEFHLPFEGEAVREALLRLRDSSMITEEEYLDEIAYSTMQEVRHEHKARAARLMMSLNEKSEPTSVIDLNNPRLKGVVLTFRED